MEQDFCAANQKSGFETKCMFKQIESIIWEKSGFFKSYRVQI